MVLFLSLSNDLFEKIYIHMTLQTIVVVFFVGPQIYLIFRNIVKIMFEAKLYLYKQWYISGSHLTKDLVQDFSEKCDSITNLINDLRCTICKANLYFKIHLFYKHKKFFPIRDAENLFEYSPNARKYGPEKLNTDTFTQCILFWADFHQINEINS